VPPSASPPPSPWKPVGPRRTKGLSPWFVRKDGRHARGRASGGGDCRVGKRQCRSPMPCLPGGRLDADAAMLPVRPLRGLLPASASTATAVGVTGWRPADQERGRPRARIVAPTRSARRPWAEANRRRRAGGPPSHLRPRRAVEADPEDHFKRRACERPDRGGITTHSWSSKTPSRGRRLSSHRAATAPAGRASCRERKSRTGPLQSSGALLTPAVMPQASVRGLLLSAVHP